MVQLRLLAAALLAQRGAAQVMLRFACSQLVVERVDPLVNPGVKYTPHLHQIVGGNSFKPEMDPDTHDLPSKSTCTSCEFNEDLSNYWTAVMFFQHKNGSFHRVPQVPNQGLTQKGGLDVYYIPGNSKTTAFKKGFRMLAGNAANTDASKVAKGNICHRCWTNGGTPFVGGAPCTGNDSVEIPADTSCKMFRQTIIFPACWDGKNLDSPNHMDHVAYSGVGATGGGSCPSSHPVKLPQVMYEIMWNVTNFLDKNTWPTDGRKPFVYSMNIGGAAAHGDYIFGWKGDSLQKAMDNKCNLNQACPAGNITTQPASKYNACTLPQSAPEEVEGWLAALPVGKPAVKA